MRRDLVGEFLRRITGVIEKNERGYLPRDDAGALMLEYYNEALENIQTPGDKTNVCTIFLTALKRLNND